MNRRLLSALCFVILAANAMGEEPVTFPDVEWEVRTPAEVGLDVAKLQELSAMVGGAGAIVRDGYMVYTWGDQNARTWQAWASASKAVVSTMLFFAINEGRLSGPNATVRTYVQQQFPGEDLIAKDVPMTFRDLANGLSGYVLPEAPGDAYAYNDYAFKLYKYLVFGQLFGVSPTSASEVAEAIAAPERLGPLQFQDGSLIAIVKGAPRWNATLRDTARLGWFWLNKGRWKAQQLLPQSLFDTYARAQVPANLPQSISNTPNDYLGLGTDGDTDPNQNPTDPHYGYNWQHNLGTDDTLEIPSAPADLFYALGNLNKVIAMVPSQNLVAVWRDGPNLTDEQRAAAMEKLTSAVVTAPPPPPPGPLPGQIIVDPQTPRWFVYNRDSDGDGKLDPFYLGGAGGPEDFFYRGTRNPVDGTRSGDQQTIINALGTWGVNGLYVIAVRSHGGDGDATHNPFVNNDPAQGLNATVLNQWEGWITALESQHVAVFFILYDDNADPFGGSTVGVAERAFIHGLIDRFENHTNIIWCVAEEYPEALVPSRVSSIAAEIRAADDHAHPIAIHQATGDNTMDFPNDPNIDQFAQQSNATTPAELHTAVLTAFNDAAGRFNVNMAEDFPAHKDDLLLRRRIPCRQRNWAAAMAGGYFMVLGAWETTTGGAVPPASWLADWGRQVSFFESTNFNEMMPRDDLRFGGTTYVLAKPGESYIAYAPDLTGALGLQGMTAGTYDLRWLDVATGTMVSQTGVIVGQGDQTWAKPATIGAELALYIRRQGDAPPPPPPLVSDLVVASGEPYQWFNLALGQNMYIDRTYRFDSPTPASINGQLTLRTANDDKFSSANATHVSFTVNQASTVYVLYTTVNTTLESTWLTDANGWSLEDYTVPTTLPGAGEAAREVRKKRFAAGATVTLNGNGSPNNISSMYNVVVVP